MKYTKITNSEVKSTFKTFPPAIKEKLLVLRELIFRIATERDEIGEINETLKWENPSYLTHAPKSGTTIRLSKAGDSDNKIAISVHCQTSLIAEFKEIYPDLEYDGNRSIVFDITNKLPFETVKHFIYCALTYHYRKRHKIGI